MGYGGFCKFDPRGTLTEASHARACPKVLAIRYVRQGLRQASELCRQEST